MGHAERLRALPLVAREGARQKTESAANVLPWPARVGDIVLTLGTTFCAMWLWTAGSWAPGADVAKWVYTGLALGPAVFRGVAQHFPRLRHFHIVANFWLIPVMVLGHCHFSPVVDSINPKLYDGQLARIDAQLFGGVPSLFTDGAISGIGMELLLICYYSYFLWPALAGAVIFVKNRAAFCEIRLAMILFFVANFILYVAVPAVGPRFFLANSYAYPLEGVWLTGLLDGLMRVTPFNRDCFPSGHTGFTLIALIYSWQYARGFFKIMFLPAMGLIAATVLGRFHYGIDLIAAVPLVLVVVSTAAMAARAEPHPVRRLAEALRKTVQLHPMGR